MEAPLTRTDQDPPARVIRWPRPLEHLATLTRNQVRFGGTGTEVPMLAEPDLIGAPNPGGN